VCRRGAILTQEVVVIGELSGWRPVITLPSFGRIGLIEWLKKIFRVLPVFSTFALLRKVERMQALVMARLDILETTTLEAHLAIGRVLSRQDQLHEAADCFQAVAARAPLNVKARSHLAEVYLQLGNADHALETIGGALSLDPVMFRLAEIILKLSINNRSPSRPRGQGPVRTYHEGTRITIGTSLMPKRIHDQRAAIRSWQRLGFDVVSVNMPSEIEQLQEHFPEVRFQAARRSAMDLCGRPLIPIAEILEALKQSGSDLVGIVNSDIVLDETTAFVDSIRSVIGGSLVLGNRIDRDRSGSTAGRTYGGGYDFFFFEASDIGHFATGDMVLGLPWWDYWMPLAAHVSGLNLKLLTGGRALHFLHPAGYKLELVEKLAPLFIRNLAASVKASYPMTGSELIRFSQTLFLAIDVHVNDFGRPFPDEAVWMLCGFANFMITHIASPMEMATAAARTPVDIVELYKAASR
jgi:hypothetical protein